MVRRVRIPVRSFGEDAPIPEEVLLTEWIREHQGMEADLITCLLDLSMHHQEGVDLPCIGGEFYHERWLCSIEGLEGRRLVGEPAPRGRDVLMDLAVVSRNRTNLWWAIPAPHLLALEDRHFGDPEEFLSAISDCYLGLMREMRDQGAYGHVLLCKRIVEEELELLSSKKRLFFMPSPSPEDLELLLEYQPEVMLPSTMLPLLNDLLDRYSIRRIALLDPDAEDITQALEHLDSDRIMVGGYCRRDCENYWPDLISRAYVTR
ncbi:MAG: hypothetical protein QHG99_04960 [Methanomicrobiales archaeon]|nr:hypothetical protein [Methanomicrobiales archaeon]